MENSHANNTASSGLSRRSITKGIAWAAPVIAAASTAPFASASRVVRSPGLNGWVTISKNCQTNNLIINGRGSFTGGGNNDRGIWIFDNNNDPGAGIQNAYIVFYYPSSLGNLTWTTQTGTNWSAPVLTTAMGPSQAGFNRYITYYTGTWTYNTVYKAWVADGQPYFTASISSTSCGSSIKAYAYRSVDVQRPNDTWENVAFLRGPVTL